MTTKTTSTKAAEAMKTAGLTPFIGRERCPGYHRETRVTACLTKPPMNELWVEWTSANRDQYRVRAYNGELMIFSDPAGAVEYADREAKRF